MNKPVKLINKPWITIGIKCMSTENVFIKVIHKNANKRRIKLFYLLLSCERMKTT